MYPISHKTIFVVDESPMFVGTSCNQAVEFDVPSKSRAPGMVLPPISKSLWTCAIESISEYCRIVWDIYPDGDRLISYVRTPPAGVLCTQKGSVLSWRLEEQSLPVLMNQLIWTSRESNFGKLNAARKYDHTNLLNGFQDAIEALGKASEIQTKAIKRSGLVLNRGRIICVSMFANDAQVMGLQEKLSQLIDAYNDSVSKTKNGNTDRLPIDGIDLLFLNSVPLNDNSQSSKIVNIPNHQVSPTLTAEVASTRSGTFLAQKLISLVLKHYNLASTTVTGIPMKEEQNASSSANYDVEIFHPESIHSDLYTTATVESLRLPKEGVEYDTLPLKWCTPRTTSAEIHYTTVATRITPVDVNSRPSSCLTNFLLSGRTVMLEMPRVKGSKFMSHMLSSHKSELYIHTLCSSRSMLEDPPSISEGVGGRVTDYRINDFGESVMKVNKVVPCVASVKGQPSPSEEAAKFLDKSTTYWPIVLGHTIMYNIQGQIGRLLELIPKETLSQEEVNECRNVLFQVVSMESKAVNLNVPGIGSVGKGKGPRKEELYKTLYKELAHFMSAHSSNSSDHVSLLNCLHDLHARPGSDGGNVSSVAASVGTLDPTATSASSIGNGSTASNSSSRERMNEQLTWKEMDRSTSTPGSINATNSVPGSSSDSALPSSLSSSSSIANSTTSNNSSAGKRSNPSSSYSPFEDAFSSGTESLLSFWTKKLKFEESRRHPEILGRVPGDGIAPLYIHLAEKMAGPSSASEEISRS